jgi:hypothetical protein
VQAMHGRTSASGVRIFEPMRIRCDPRRPMTPRDARGYGRPVVGTVLELVVGLPLLAALGSTLAGLLGLAAVALGVLVVTSIADLFRRRPRPAAGD